MIPSSDTPVLVQAALLPIELSKPTTSQHPTPEATPERTRPSALPGPPSALPGPLPAFSGPPSAYPGPPSALPGPTQAFPGPSSALPGSTQAFSGPTQAFPGTPSALPGTPSAFPGQPSALPGPPPAFAGPPSTFSAPAPTFPGPPSAYSGPQSAPQGSYLPLQPFPPSAKLASVDHATIPPPSTVQEPTTSAPYGGGQPPARAANPQMAYSTPQTPPYSNPPQPYPPYSQPTQQPDDRQTPPQSGYMQARSQPYSQPAQPMNQPIPQPLNQPPNQPIPQSQNQTIPQSQNQPTPQPRPRPQVPPRPISPPQPAPQSPTQSRTPNPPVGNPSRSPISSSRISEAGGRNSSIPQPYSSARITAYPPARPVLPMPKPPPHLLHILQQQEEQRKQQQYFLLQQQLQSMQNLQHQVIEEGQQRYQSEAPRQRASTADSRPCDLERDSDDTETQSTDAGRPSLKQRPRLNKRIVTVSPHRSTPPAQAAPQPATSPPSTTGASSNPNQRICTVPPHPYGTIIPRFSTQHAFNVSHNLASQGNRVPLTYSAQPPPRPDYLQNPLPGPTVTRPPNSALASSYYQNLPSTQKPPETTTRNTICQTDPMLEEYSSKPQGCAAKHDPESQDAPSLSPVSEPLHPSPQASQPSESPQSPNQTQGIQARLSHAQPLHSPALQTTHVMGSIQTIQSSPVKYTDCAQGKEDFYVPAYSVQPANRTSFSERNSGQSLLQQQQSFQMPPWQQLRQTPSPQYIQLGTFPPSMATFARPPSGGFVQSITERPLKLSLPSQMQTTQLYPQNFSNVGVGIRSANSCPGDVRIGAFHPGLMHGHRPGSPHHTRARSAGRVSVSESTASVWASNSNPHHLP